MNRRRASAADRASEARSRALEAFRMLMLERGYRRVTIRSVLERARIGRATFYVHFRGKEDLLAASVGGLGASLAAAGRQQRASGIDEPLAFVRPLFHHLRRSQRMLAVLAERDTDVLLREHLTRTFAGLVRDELTVRHERAPDEVAVQFVVGALWGVMMWWSRTPDVMPAAAADAFNALAAPVIGISGERAPTRGRARSSQR